MNPWQAAFIGVLSAFAASSGFWTYLITRRDKKSASARLLLGLAHDKIITHVNEHIARGYITSDAYDDLHRYLYEPYKEMGGNGTVDRLMKEVAKLPIRSMPIPPGK